MSLATFLFRSSLGRKYVMGVTGLLLFGFVIVHMAGNLQVFLGPGPINAYAEALKSNPLLLWGARAGLLFIAALHISSALGLASENRRARPVKYESGAPPIASSYAARTIVVSGIVLLAFIAFHLAHFTIGVVDPEYLEMRDFQGRHDVYRMVIAGFSNPAVSLFYILSMGLLCLHLSHGVSSSFQSLGLRNHKTIEFFKKAAWMVAVLVFLGNCSIPAAILTGIIR
ncbi:MAG: succinate dehydrogenase cytochrome b subunit [Blastocatellales bacterium]|nr:succinate dehydrogenase cytochrome b subunit [Blastocatellales bacterium]